ncbi:ribonuclease H-like domain-containing protein [Tanacetum coccineum]
MDLETAQTTTTAKLPIFKQGEYDMWRLRIEQYFQVHDYALWDIIKNGNSFKPAAQTTTNVNGTSTTLIPGPVTTEEKVQKKNDVKARSMLLMALPNEHLMTFNHYKDAKTLFAESLDFIFNRLRKIVSQLAILGENISQEDLNLKFLRILPSEWNTHVVVWRNKPDLDTMSFDYLYNNFTIVDQEVKRTTSSSSSLSSQNMAFMSSPSSTNEVNTTYGVSTTKTQVSPASTQVSTASTQVSTTNLSDDTVYAFLASQPNGSQFVYEDLEQYHEDELEEIDLKWQLALLSMRTRMFFYKIGRKITINRSDTAGYDKSKVECFNCHKMGYFARECRGPRNQDSRNRNQDSSRRTVNVEETSSKAMVAIDGAGLFSPQNIDLSYSGVEEFQQPEFESYGPKPSKSVSEYISNEVRKSPDAPLVEELVLDDKLEKKTVFPTVAKIEFADCNNHQRERVVSGNNYTRVNYNYSAKKTHPSAHRNMVPRAVLMKTSLRSLNTARPVNTAHPKTIDYSARPMSHFSKSAQSTVKSPYQIRTALTNKNFGQKVNTAKGKFYTAWPKAINTARPNSAVVNAVRENQGHPQKEDQGYVDGGCSRHMTGNMSYPSDFKEFDKGYVTFRGGAKGGKITGKGTLKTGAAKRR